MYNYAILPHLALFHLFTKHHMREQKIINLSLNNYRLASSFCREECSKGVVCIRTRNGINFNKTDFNKFFSKRHLKYWQLN
jgi:hypothetical protein